VRYLVAFAVGAWLMLRFSRRLERTNEQAAAVAAAESLLYR